MTHFLKAAAYFIAASGQILLLLAAGVVCLYLACWLCGVA